MDQAALRERRAARKRQVRRRRQATLGGVLVALLGVVAALASGGGDGPPAAGERAGATAARGAATSAATPGAKATTTSARAAPRPASPARRVRATMAGAHLAPREAVPILMYHVIGERTPTAPNPSLWVSPAELAAHVHGLVHAGYHGVTLSQVWSAWHDKGKLPAKPIVMSFDDGYTGQVRDALPTLARAGWPGVLNLEVSNITGMGGTRAVKRLIGAGWEIGAHTLTHPDLTTLDAVRLRDQIRGSRTSLQRDLGVGVSFFCYPSGRYDDAVVAAVKAAGYRGATTTAAGWASPAGDPFTLSRVRVDGGMSAAAVLQRIHDERGAAPS